MDKQELGAGPLSIADVAALYGVNGSTVRRWCIAGKLKATKLHGWAWIIQPKDLELFREIKEER